MVLDRRSSNWVSAVGFAAPIFVLFAGLGGCGSAPDESESGVPDSVDAPVLAAPTDPADPVLNRPCDVNITSLPFTTSAAGKKYCLLPLDQVSGSGSIKVAHDDVIIDGT